MLKKIPVPVLDVMNALSEAGFEAFAVGGSVRDLLLNKEPKDWDITTNATPDQVQKIFPESFYENEFGTVGVKTPRFLATTPISFENDIIEVTTYRRESNYEDKRRPKEVTFSLSLEEDLSRRDFTINAMAYGMKNSSWLLVDPYQGEKDLEKKIIRTVGKPEERFNEDALRLVRAIRFLSELYDPKEKDSSKNWSVAKDSLEAIIKLSANIEAISKERIRDELSKIIISPNPAFGIDMLQKTGLLRFILPELEAGIGVTQNLHHIYTVWEHNLRALATCPSPKLEVRLAALLHDVGKPQTKRGEGYRSTFYNHDHVGAKIAEKALARLRFSRDTINKICLLIDNHLFYYNVGEVTEASVRRLIKRVGLENMSDLMDVRIGDRLGSGVPKGKTYKLRHLEYMIEKVSKDPLSVKMLAINGNDLITELSLKPSPKIGALLDVLLSEVIEDPKKNSREALLERARVLEKNNLKELRDLAKEKISEKKKEEDLDIKKKYWVE